MNDPEPRSYLSSRFLFCVGLLLLGPALPAAADTGLVADPSSSDVILLLSYVLLALLFSFMCSVAEAVLLSITPSFIAELESSDPKRAALLKKLKGENIDRSLAAILTLNTIAHTVGAIGAGAKATVVFGSAWFGVFSAVMTLLILFLSEILPKTLGAVYWRSLTGVTALYVNFLIKSMYPLILVSEKLTKLIARGQTVHVFSRDEFIAMASIGQQAGHINDRESRIIRNLFRFGSLRAQDIMTPRTVMVALRESLNISDALQAKMNTPFSRIPVYAADLDAVTGFVLREDLLMAETQGTGDRPLTALRRDILAVAGATPLSTLLELLLDKRHHIAVVIGEYGETKGVVTLEDVVETLLGIEIVDEGDKVDDMQHLARQLWVKRARALGLEVDATNGASSADAGPSGH
ncbi:CNNM domain-containing protein [Pseudothauera lacus]|uniref:CNNM domain-containing protein n=1 Tax=Pseudothauera lacus TaxID=2136175 RepID=UPI001C6274E1|nr:CNNM domain-containing protein [Pseudothauera lacus]